jgi:carbamoyl-phosphate synthase large subunit
LQKFQQVSTQLGSEMKSVGEVMSLGRSFEEVLQKAIRMLDVGLKGFVCNDLNFTDLDKELSQPTDKRIFAIAVALQKGYSVEKINQLTKITPWFLFKMKNIVETELKLKQSATGGLPGIDFSIMKEAKQNGFSDLQIADLIHSTENEVREKRKSLNVLPVVKQIDTMAAEYPAQTNYLYLTYHGNEHDISVREKNQIAVIGSGAYRIGSSVEFDWCCVTAVQAVNSSWL